jgi:hypothetical protein
MIFQNIIYPSLSYSSAIKFWIATHEKYILIRGSYLQLLGFYREFGSGKLVADDRWAKVTAFFPLDIFMNKLKMIDNLCINTRDPSFKDKARNTLSQPFTY